MSVRNLKTAVVKKIIVKRFVQHERKCSAYDDGTRIRIYARTDNCT